MSDEFSIRTPNNPLRERRWRCLCGQREPLPRPLAVISIERIFRRWRRSPFVGAADPRKRGASIRLGSYNHHTAEIRINPLLTLLTSRVLHPVGHPPRVSAPRAGGAHNRRFHALSAASAITANSGVDPPQPLPAPRPPPQRARAARRPPPHPPAPATRALLGVDGVMPHFSLCPPLYSP